MFGTPLEESAINYMRAAMKEWSVWRLPDAIWAIHDEESDPGFEILKLAFTNLQEAVLARYTEDLKLEGEIAWRKHHGEVISFALVLDLNGRRSLALSTLKNLLRRAPIYGEPMFYRQFAIVLGAEVGARLGLLIELSKNLREETIWPDSGLLDAQRARAVIAAKSYASGFRSSAVRDYRILLLTNPAWARPSYLQQFDWDREVTDNLEAVRKLLAD